MLKKVLVPFVCLVLVQLSYIVHAKQSVATAPRPNWVVEVKLPADSKIAKHEVSGGYVYALRDFQFHLSSQTKYIHYVRNIYTATGVQQGSEIEVSYDPSYQRLVFHEVKIIREGRAINKLEPAKFKIIQRETSKESYIYDGSLLALLILEDVRAGDQLEYSFSLIGNNPVYEGAFASSFYLGSSEPIDAVSIRLISPSKLQVKSLHTDIQPTVTEQNGQVIYEWYKEHIPGITYDNDTPTWYNPYPRVMVSQYNSWQEVNKWALKHYTFPVTPSKELQAAIDKIKSETGKSAERLEKALELVQDEIRYTGLEGGIGAYKPRNPSAVFRQRFGDCKDKALLLCYLLKELGIEAYPALVSTSDRKGIKDWLPAPNIFDHCVVQVRLGDTYWYDATTSHQGGTFFNRYFSNLGYALVIRPDTKDLTKIEPSKSSKTKVEEVFTLPDIGGPVTLTVTTHYYGYEADQQRYSFANANLKITEKNYLNYTAKSYPQLKVKEPLRFEDNRASNVFITHEMYEIENFWDAPDSTLPQQLECVVYPQTLRDKLSVPATKIRTAPFALEYPLYYEHIIRFELPEPWSVEDQEQEIKGPGIVFNSAIKYKNDQITLTYTYQTTQDYVEAGATAAFIKKQNQIISSLGYSLTYNQNAGQSEAEFRINWLMVLLALLFTATTGWGALKIYQYDPEPVIATENGIGIGSWLYLFAFGLFIRPLLHFIQIFNSSYFNWYYWENITTQTSSAYNPTLATILVAELFYNIAMLGFCIALVLLFVRQRSSVPNLVSILYAVSIACIALETYFLWNMQLLSENEQTVNSLVWLVISAAVWVPYFHLSRRAKETFVYTLRVSKDQQEVYRLN